MTQLYTFYIVEIKNCNAYIDLSDGFKSIGCFVRAIDLNTSLAFDICIAKCSLGRESL